VSGIARFSLVALDCPDAPALAAFYAQITGWDTGSAGHDTWVQLRSDTGATIAFQQVADFEPPDWPDGERPQQAHLDFDVPDLDEGESQVLAIGARRTAVQPDPEEFRVFLDPAGHPFCLVKAGS
jgi:catechol 2,3-dioxygenase-like lactoylglutathione lyase family enzyme